MRQIDEQRYLWLFRVFCILFVLSVVANFTLLLTFFEISPEPKREAFFVSAQSDTPKEFFIQRSIRYGMSRNDIGYGIAEAYISDYVVNRESVYSDGALMQKMWGYNGPVYYYSTKDVYNAFVKSSEYRNSLINKDKLVVSVDIKKITYQPQSREWIVDVSLKTTNTLGLDASVTTKKIRITADFITGKEKLNKNKWENPLGFKITSYQYV